MPRGAQGARVRGWDDALSSDVIIRARIRYDISGSFEDFTLEEVPSTPKIMGGVPIGSRDLIEDRRGATQAARADLRPLPPFSSGVLVLG